MHVDDTTSTHIDTVPLDTASDGDDTVPVVTTEDENGLHGDSGDATTENNLVALDSVQAVTVDARTTPTGTTSPARVPVKSKRKKARKTTRISKKAKAKLTENAHAFIDSLPVRNPALDSTSADIW